MYPEKRRACRKKADLHVLNGPNETLPRDRNVIQLFENSSQTHLMTKSTNNDSAGSKESERTSSTLKLIKLNAMGFWVQSRQKAFFARLMIHKLKTLFFNISWYETPSSSCFVSPFRPDEKEICSFDVGL